MSDFMQFKKMLTPVIIQILFWLGSILSVLVGLGLLIFGLEEEKLLGLILILLGPIVVRIYGELLIVVFTINDTLTEIHRSLKEK